MLAAAAITAWLQLNITQLRQKIQRFIYQMKKTSDRTHQLFSRGFNWISDKQIRQLKVPLTSLRLEAPGLKTGNKMTTT